MKTSKDPETRESSPRQRPPFLTELFATGFYSGYAAWASGTSGTLVGALVYYAVPGSDNPLVLCTMILLGFAVGVVTSGRVADTEGHRLTETAEAAKAAFQAGAHPAPDPSIVVIDEIVGMWITMLWLPKSLPVMAAGFLAFRAFDIVKPYPARQVERIPHGWGIMLDDVFAGIYALVVTHVIVYLLNLFIPGLLV